jgi:hypothetical protein
MKQRKASSVAAAAAAAAVGGADRRSAGRARQRERKNFGWSAEYNMEFITAPFQDWTGGD